MTSKKIIIVFESYHHRNTETIAQVMAQRFQAELFKSEQVNILKLSDFDIIGIGTGIYFGKPHEKIQKFLANLSLLKGHKAFLFSTSGILKEKYTHDFREKIESAGLQCLACFSCKGLDTHGFFQLVGGRNQGHPDLKDLYHAEIFANNLINRL
jgi:flavodoxin